MIRKGFLALYCAIITLTGIAQVNISGTSKIRIALVSNHIEKGELAAIEKLLQSEKDWTYAVIDLKEIKSEKAFNNFTHIWYHRTDTGSFDKNEVAAGVAIKKFVQAGGNLFLSMESVPLLNQWKIETTAFQFKKDTLLDKGFGRPAGFHAFKSHPLFNGLNGGVYTTKQKKDHMVRKHGFFDKTIPQVGKVIGIQWTYITFTESSKLLLEYKLGKGTVIAAGAYLYYDADNYNEEHLSHFTKNVFRYTTGQIKDVKKEYWNYQRQNISAASFLLPTIPPVAAKVWTLPKPTLRMTNTLLQKIFMTW